MRKALLALAMIFTIPSSAAYMSSCYNYGDGVSYSFTSCINRNFREAGASFSCYNYGDDLSYSFQSCVNNNFRDVARDLDVFVSSCNNYGDGVSFSYESCVNRNFRTIERALNSQE